MNSYHVGVGTCNDSNKNERIKLSWGLGFGRFDTKHGRVIGFTIHVQGIEIRGEKVQ